MPEQDDRVESLKSQGVDTNFARFAVAYLRHGGVDPENVDIAAEYDSTLTFNENKQNFMNQYPTTGATKTTATEAREYEQRANAERMQELQRARQEAQEQRKMEAKEQIEKYGIKKEEKSTAPEFISEEDLGQTQETKKPGLIQSAFTGIGNLIVPSEEVRTAREKEAQFREIQKQKSLEQKLATSKLKAENRASEKLQAQYAKEELQESPVGRLAVIGGSAAKGIAKAVAPQGYAPGSSAIGYKPPSDEVLRKYNVSGTGLTSAAGFRGKQSSSQPGGRGRYITVVERGVAKRIRIPASGESPQGAAPSGSNALARFGATQRTAAPEEPSLINRLLTQQASPAMQSQQMQQPSMIRQLLTQPRQGQGQGQQEESPITRLMRQPSSMGNRMGSGPSPSPLASLILNPKGQKGQKAPYERLMDDIAHPKRR